MAHQYTIELKHAGGRTVRIPIIGWTSPRRKGAVPRPTEVAWETENGYAGVYLLRSLKRMGWLVVPDSIQGSTGENDGASPGKQGEEQNDED